MRLCLSKPEIFRTQLRAALRASCYGNLWLMLPMVSGLDEIRKAKECIEAVRWELTEEGIPYRENIPVGIMIEIPSVALIADLIVKEVDFASVGTNDLCQYLMAAVKKVISMYRLEEAEKTSEMVLNCGTEEEVLSLLERQQCN